MLARLELIGAALTVLLSMQAAAAAPAEGRARQSRLADKSGGSAPAKSSAKPRASRTRTPPKPLPPAIELEHLTTHATYKLRPDSPRGGFSPAKLRALAQLLRCHHTGKRHLISERLIEILYATSRHYHNAKLLIVAGYRAPKIARQKGNPKSPHKRGVACDFQVAGVSNEAVRDYLQKAYPKIGLGYYPRAGFVHVDVGRTRGAYWIDYSSPGQPARYGAGEVKDEAATDADAPGVAIAQRPAAAVTVADGEVPETDTTR